MKRKLAVVAGVVALALATAAPAVAINDGVTPAGQGCAQSDSAVGTPGGGPNPGIARDNTPSPPVSQDNPNSRGGQGFASSGQDCS
jgi:hypothetical protein